MTINIYRKAYRLSNLSVQGMKKRLDKIKSNGGETQMLSTEDIKILTLEKQKRENDARYANLDNSPEREKLHAKSWKLMEQINAMVFDSRGMFRKDKTHLLTGGSLDISLIETK